MTLKIRLINKIRKLINEFNSIYFTINTNKGDIVNIYINNDLLILVNDKQRKIIANNCKISTLYQIVNCLNKELTYIKIVKNIKKNKNHWDEKRKKWTHIPIKRKKIFEYINNKNENFKYIAKRKKENG